MNPILIDDRAGSAELEPFIPGTKEITRLNSGDFAIFGNGPTGLAMVGVERKTLGDLIQSMESGRLSGHQLGKLQEDYEYVYLLVEGLWRPRAKDGLLEHWKGRWKPYHTGRRRYMARDIGNYLNTLAVCCGVMIWRTDTPQHTGKWLADLRGWWNKPWDKHRSHINQFVVPPPSRAYLTKPTLLHRVIKELEGVGWDKGKAIAEHFGSMSNLLFASEESLREVPGIGKTLARRIYRQIGSIR